MKKISFYFHAGSKNHGCEAIVRSTASLLGMRVKLFSDRADDDRKYGIHEIADVLTHDVRRSSFAERAVCAIESRILKGERFGYDVLARQEADDFMPGSVALSIGGDNYCYGRAYNLHLAALNRHLKKRGVKTVLWGCSINPDEVTAAMRKDFANYDLIVARESISYELLKTCNPHTLIACDPAFLLEKKIAELPERFIPKKTVGINVSPLIEKLESKEGIVKKSFQALVQYIIDNTDYQIALIPHVVSDGNDDRRILRKIYEDATDKARVCMVDDQDCRSLKGVISQCCLFVGARTHATIAAYSSFVPTLVVGYSTKAMGIARDLFGTEEGFVIRIEDLEDPTQLLNSFIQLDANKLEIAEKLMSTLPDYTRNIELAKSAILELTEDSGPEKVELADCRLCTGCMACVEACSTSSIYVSDDEFGFPYPSIERDTCVECRRCVNVCPVINPSKGKEVELCEAAYCKEGRIRNDSSSGGIFSLLAENALQNGGVVYGAAYDKDFRVIHQRVADPSSLECLRGAKYAQSSIDSIYESVKKDLDNGLSVVFVGAPCQSAALRLFLGRPREGLLVVDFVCHGVPSPLAWKQYVSARVKYECFNGKPIHINMRSKESGWSGYRYSTQFEYENGATSLIPSSEDPYLKLFTDGLICRRSCYDCSFKDAYHSGDITLGDFWGIWDIDPGMDDDQGTSLVIVRSEAGIRALRAIGEKAISKKIPLAQALRGNASATESLPPNAARKETLRRVCADSSSFKFGN